MSARRAAEGSLEIGASERRVIAFDFTNWNLGTLTSPSVAVFDVTEGARTDVTATIMPTNTPTVNGQVVTTSIFRGDVATVGHAYRVECLIEHGDGERSELYVDVVVYE